MGPNPNGSGCPDRLSFNPFVISLSSTSCQCANTKNLVPRQRKEQDILVQKQLEKVACSHLPSLPGTHSSAGTSAGLINGKTQCLVFKTGKGGCRPVHQSLNSILDSPAEASRR